ncbi:hypothetical protein HK102_004434 [Quaeritorhiza haematococci]|nr:hypothetical protein HK102_004434 [Quaeritorhiza haematococci]
MMGSNEQVQSTIVPCEPDSTGQPDDDTVPTLPAIFQDPSLDPADFSMWVGVGVERTFRRFRRLHKKLDNVMENLLTAWSSGLPHIRGYVFAVMSDLAMDSVLRGRLLENEQLLQILFETPLLEIVQEEGADEESGKAEDEVVTEAVVTLSPILQTCLSRDLDSFPTEVADVLSNYFNLEKIIRTFVSRCSHPVSSVRMYTFRLFGTLAERDLGQDILRENEKAVDMLVGYLRCSIFRFRLQSSLYIMRFISSNAQAPGVARLPTMGLQRKLTKLPPQLAEIVEADPYSVHHTVQQNTADCTHFVNILESVDYKAAGSLASRIIQTTELGFLGTKINLELLLSVATNLREQDPKSLDATALYWCEMGISIWIKTCGSSGSTAHVMLGLLRLASICCIELSDSTADWDEKANPEKLLVWLNEMTRKMVQADTIASIMYNNIGYTNIEDNEQGAMVKLFLEPLEPVKRSVLEPQGVLVVQVWECQIRNK